MRIERNSDIRDVVLCAIICCCSYCECAFDSFGGLVLVWTGY